MLKCEICQEPLASNEPRALRQHAKSRAHRNAVAAAASDSNAGRSHGNGDAAGDPGAALTGEGSNASVTNADGFHSRSRTGKRGKRSAARAAGAIEPPCPHCGHPISRHHAAVGDEHTESGESMPSAPCFPPEFVRTPRAAEWTLPFVTGWKHAAHWEGEDWSFDEIVEWGCRPGNWRRFPNIDIEGKNICVESFHHAKKVLDDHSGGSCKPAWISFDAADELDQPSWFVATPNGCPAVRLVPTYSYVLVSSGPRVSIGLHQDTDNREMSSSVRPPLICTYLTVAQGAKHVMLVHPKTPPDELNLFKRLWLGPCQSKDVLDGKLRSNSNQVDDALDDTEDVEENDDSIQLAFDDIEEPSAEIRNARETLRRSRGYLFRLCQGQTLLVPKGWHHWLVAENSVSVTLSGSRY